MNIITHKKVFGISVTRKVTDKEILVGAAVLAAGAFMAAKALTAPEPEPTTSAGMGALALGWGRKSLVLSRRETAEKAIRTTTDDQVLAHLGGAAAEAADKKAMMAAAVAKMAAA